MIDGGLFWGRNPASGAELSESALLEWLESSGCDAALVAAYSGIYFDYAEANHSLSLLAARHPQKIIPAATVQPAGFDISQGGAYFEMLKSQGIKALGIYLSPNYYDISLGSPLVQEIVRLALEKGLVVQIGIRNAADVAQLSKGYAALQGSILIRWMNGRGYQSYAEALNLALQHEQFYFDVGSLTSSGLIKHFTQRIGANRLYFTSNRPESFAWTSHFLLRSAGLTSAELEQIYHGTLANVFNLPRVSSQKVIQMPVRFQSLMNRPKVDTHWHTEGWNLIEPEKGTDYFEPAKRKYNITKTVVSSIRALNGDMEKGNHDLFNYAATQEGVFALIVVDPLRIEASLAQMDRYAHHPKAVGIKTIQDLYGLELDADAYGPLFNRASTERLSVMAHIPGLLRASQKYSDVTFICAHATYERVMNMLRQPNIYFDIATSHHDECESKLEKLIKEAGEDKILFASDSPLMSPAWTLGKLAGLDLQESQTTKIFYENACRAFPKLANEI